MPLTQMPDSRIALTGDTSPVQSPFGTLGQMMQIKEAQAQMQERQQQLAAQKRLAEDDDAIRTTLPRYDRPDEAIDDLYRQGRATAAAKLGKSIYDQRKAQTEAYDQQIAGVGKRLETASQIMGSVTDDAGYQPARKAVYQMLQPIYGDAVNDMLPTTYDAARVKQLVQAGTKRSDQLAALRESTSSLQKAYDAGLMGATGADANGAPIAPKLDANGVPQAAMYSANGQAARQEFRRSVASALKAAGSDADRTTYLQALDKQGVPRDILQEAPKWNADPKAYQQSLQDFSTTQKEKDDAAKEANTNRHQLETEKTERARIALEGQRVQIEKQRADNAGNPKPVKPLSQKEESDLSVRRAVANAKAKDVYDKETKEAYGVDDLKQAADDKFRATRIDNENAFRSENPWRYPDGSMEQTAQAAVDRGDAAAYKKITSIYDSYGGAGALAKVIPWKDGGTPAAAPAASPAAPAASPASRPAASRPLSTQELRKQLDALQAEAMDPTTSPARRAQINIEAAKLRYQR